MARSAFKTLLDVLEGRLTIDPKAQDSSDCGCALPDEHWGSHGWHFRRRTAEEVDPGQQRYLGQPIAYEMCPRPPKPEPETRPRFERRRR